MLLKPDDTVLFTGDSITDCGRNRNAPFSGDPSATGAPALGNGYAHLIAEHFLHGFGISASAIFNRGISGNRIYDVEARIEPDLLALKPTVVSILIGINDVWRRYDQGIVSETAEFQASYRRILERVRGELGARIIILEPFVLPVPPDRRAWRADLDPKITAIRELAAEFASVYVPLDGLFAAACCQSPAAQWLPDGVHPSPAGHGLIADAWTAAVRGAGA